MSQSEVISFLRSNMGRPFTEREISLALDKSSCKVVLKSLRKHHPEGFSYRRSKINRNRWAFVYEWKRLFQSIK